MALTSKEALELVERQLNEWNNRHLNDHETIELLQEEVRTLREEKEEIARDAADEVIFYKNRLSHAYRSHDYTLIQMFWACALAFISTGLLVWTF